MNCLGEFSTIVPMGGLNVLEEFIIKATQLIERTDEDITAVLPNLSIFRQLRDSAFDGTVYHPLFCVILRGRKEFQVHDNRVSITTGEAFVISHEMPIESYISGAQPGSPYLSLILSLDMGILRSLYDEIGSTLAEDLEAKSVTKGPFQLDWAEPLYRYLSLSGNSPEEEVLGPLALKEVHFRLLMSTMGGMLRNLLFANSQASRIAKAIQYIREHFREPLSVSDVTKVASMSQSSFFDHFKSVTGTTPVQYQKDLRLIEARNLLHSGGWSVSSAGLEVGYESPSHFSRDYTRKYSCSPKHHLARVRANTRGD